MQEAKAERHVRFTMMKAWLAASLVGWLVMWAAINAPPVAGWFNDEPLPADRMEGVIIILVGGWVVHGVVYFMLVNMRSMLNEFDHLKREL